MNAELNAIDWGAQVVAKLDMATIETPDGLFRFIIGQDGRFVDIYGKEWWGSTLIQGGAQEVSINGTAPSGEVSLSYFADPSMPDLVGDVRALGLDYVKGRAICFFVQPFTDSAEIYAPVLPPILVMKRVMTGLTIRAEGDMIRRLSVSFEGAWEARRAQKRLVYNTADHSLFVGAPNPSFEFIPTNAFQEEKLFG